MSKNQLPILLFTLCLACAPNIKDPKLISSYFPESKKLETGVANKYYVHVSPSNNKEPFTIVEYITYKKVSDNNINVNRYNTGFELKSSQLLAFQGAKLMLLQDLFMKKRDSVFWDISNPLLLDLEQREDFLSMKSAMLPNDRSLTFSKELLSLSDTVIHQTTGILAQQIITRDESSANGENQDSFRSTRLWLGGFGLYHAVIYYPQLRYEYELVEQMSLEEFQQRSNHGLQRIGYIDNNNTMDQKEGFVLCGHPDDIADYYNSENAQTGYSLQKKVLVSSIRAEFDEQYLFSESGYLTFRFVVNCNGESAWYTTEESDLNFQHKTFNSQTVDYLYSIISKYNRWKPVMLKEEARDAYFYITFKLNNGKLDDILP